MAYNQMVNKYPENIKTSNLPPDLNKNGNEKYFFNSKKVKIP